LRQGGFVAAEEEAIELTARADGDAVVLMNLLDRRLRGEPLAWIIGSTRFCGIEILVAPGVYVPRWQSSALAERAAARLPATGTAVDLCTGSGAIAKSLMIRQPQATVLACDLDERAVACATSNGVRAYPGDLFRAFPVSLRGQVDVVVAVVPYVPTAALDFLPRDTLAFESPVSYDGGADGTAILRRVLRASVGYLRPGGALLLEVGGDQDEILAPLIKRLGYEDLEVFHDEDGDLRALEMTAPNGATPPGSSAQGRGTE
jgi:release factor glutamine methyltransferase